jgi:hypothetical protein
MTVKKDKKIDPPSRIPKTFKFAATACSLVLTALLTVTTWKLYDRHFGEPPPEITPVLRPFNETLVMQRTAAKVLAQYILDHYENPRVLVISPPTGADIDLRAETASRDALVADLETAKIQVVTAEPEVDTEALPLAGLWFSADAFDAVADRFSDVDIVVSVIGLPVRPGDMKFWKKRPRPGLMVLNGQVYRLAEIISGGGIQAVVTRRPTRWPPDEMPPADSPEYWLLVSPENVDEIRARHRNLFVAPAADSSLPDPEGGYSPNR